MRKFLHQRIDEAIRDNPDQIPLDLQGGSNLQKPKRPRPPKPARSTSWTPWDAITRQGDSDRLTSRFAPSSVGAVMQSRSSRSQNAKVSIDAVMAAVEADDNIGFCTGCGAEAHGVEPDARGYPCEAW